MRYVIAISVVTVFLIWDVSANDSRYIRQGVVQLKHITSMVGL